MNANINWLYNELITIFFMAISATCLSLCLILIGIELITMPNINTPLELFYGFSIMIIGVFVFSSSLWIMEVCVKRGVKFLDE